MADSKPESENVEESLRKSIADLFNDLPYRHYPSRQIIIYQGDRIDRVYYIISGYVKMYNITPKGNIRTLVILGPGEGLPLIQSETADYFYEALTPVEAAYGTYEKIVERFLSNAEYMEAARQSGVNLMKRMMEQMDALASDTAIEKLEQGLRFLAKYYGEDGDDFSTIKFRATHQELGNFVNLTRETVSHLMQKLEKRKVIKVNKGGYIKVFHNEDTKAAKSSKKDLELEKSVPGFA